MTRRKNKPTLRTILDERTYRKARRRSRRRQNLAHKRQGRDLEQDRASMESMAAAFQAEGLDVNARPSGEWDLRLLHQADNLRRRAVKLSGRVY